MQNLVLIANMLKSGAINLSADNEALFQLIAKDDKIDFNILNNRFLNELIKDNKKLSSVRYLIKSLKVLAKELRYHGTTVTISYKGEKIITIGSDAKPKFSHLLTRTTDFEINNLKRLIQLGGF